jgi:hypothetical protein
MSYDHVKDRTSSVVGTEDDSGALFDETIAAYSLRKQRAQEFLVDTMIDAHYKAFYAYLRRPQWTTINEDPAAIDPASLAVTAELDEPLRVRTSCPKTLFQPANKPDPQTQSRLPLSCPQHSRVPARLAFGP